MNVSLTCREIEMILAACGEYIEVMGEAEGTSEFTQYMIDTGLGSALRKISKGQKIAEVYKNHKTVTKYPSFEEWKANRDGLPTTDENGFSG